LLGPRDGARTEFRDEFTQRFRTSGVRYDYRATGVYQMTADCGRYGSRPYKPYFHSCFCFHLIIDIATCAFSSIVANASL
jgi:hypothetical protein